MALSGSFTGSTNNSTVKPKITWSAVQNIAENYSMVTATLTYSRTNSGYTTGGAWNGSITINGTTTTGTASINITYNSNTEAMSATVKVPHDTDGSKEVEISCTGGIPVSSMKTTTCESTVILDRIPRQADITSSSDFTDLDNPTVYYSNPAGSAVDSLKACISFTGANDDIKYRDIPKTGTSDTLSYQFELTEEERNILRNNTTSDSRNVIFFIRTIIGSATYHSTDTKLFTVAETDDTRPSVSMTATLNNGSLPSEFDGLYIQGKSRLDVSISAQGKYSAKITGYSVDIGGEIYNPQTIPFLSNVLQKAGKVSIIGYAKDSRKFTGSEKQEIEVIEYSKPLVSPIGSDTAIYCYRSDGNGKRVGNSTSVWIKAKRSYYSLSGKNQCALQWRSKLTTEAWNDSTHQWKDLIPKTNTTTNAEYNALLSGEVFDLKKSYSIQIMAIDDVGEVDIKTFELPTQDVALHLGKGGKNVSVGTYCDYSKEYTFYSDWDAYFDKDVYVGGNKIGDFVVEQGQNGVWTYRKWNNGLAECWGNIAFDFYDNPTANTFSFNYEKDVDLPLNLFDGKPKGLGTVDISGVVNYYAWLSSETKAKIYVNTFMKYGSDNVATLTLYFIGKSKQL
jgi:hypothetical protein